MNIELFGNGLAFCLLAAIVTCITFLQVKFLAPAQNQKGKKRAWYNKTQSRAVLVFTGSAFGLAWIFSRIVQLMDTADKIPSSLCLVLWPLTLGILLLIFLIRQKRWKYVALATATVMCAIFFAILMLNNYYRYYPTLYSLLGVEERSAALNGLKTTTVHYSRSDTVRPPSIEQNLYGATPLQGQVKPVVIPGTLSKFDARPAWVYIPPAAAGSTKTALPVIILMAGVPGSPTDWLNGGGVQATMDGFARAHHGIAPLVFMVDNVGSRFNDTECVDSPRGNVETYLSQDVPEYIKSHYLVSKDPSHWAVGGLSLGGYCSAMLALRHPDVFHYFMDFGGENVPEIGSPQKTIKELFNGSEQAYFSHSLIWLLKHQTYHDMGGFFTTAKGDKVTVSKGVENLYRESKSAGFTSVLEQINGEHTFVVWQESFRDALPWVSNQLGATECTVTCY